MKNLFTFRNRPSELLTPTSRTRCGSIAVVERTVKRVSNECRMTLDRPSTYTLSHSSVHQQAATLPNNAACGNNKRLCRSTIPSFKKVASLLLLFALSFGFSSQAWASMGFENSDNGVKFWWKQVGKTASEYDMYHGRTCDTKDLGTVETLYLKSFKAKLYQNEDNLWGDGKLHYNVHRTAVSAGSFKDVDKNYFKWNDPWNNGWRYPDFGNGGDLSINLLSGLGSGKYTFEYYITTTSSNGDLYCSNDSKNFKATFTYNPIPAVSGFASSVANSGGGNGTSSNPYIVFYNQNVNLTVSATASPDANSVLQFKVGTGSWTNATSGTTFVTTIKSSKYASNDNVAISYRYYNSADALAGAEGSTTIYYRSAQSTVTLNANGGTDGDKTSTTAKYGQTTFADTYTSTIVSKVGYNFTGWWTNDATPIKVAGTQKAATLEKSVANYTNSDGKWIRTGDVTLYAGWTAKTYSVTLDKDGGSSGVSSVTATYDAAMPELSTTPAKTGYDFGGYFDQKNGQGTKYYNADKSSAHIWDKAEASTLYAYWTPKTYKVTLSQTSATTQGTTSVTATYNATLPAIETLPQRTGYTFGGYNTNTSLLLVNAQGEWQANVSGFTDADGKWIKTTGATLSPIWNPITTTVTLKANGGTGDDQTFDVVFDSDINTTGKTAHTRTGYDLKGYFTAATNGSKILEANLAVRSGSSAIDGWLNASNKWKNPNTTADLYAQWTAHQWTITLDDNEGTGGDGSKPVTYGTNTGITSVTKPTRETYNFAGYEDANQVLVYDANGDLTANVTGYTDASKKWIYDGDVTLSAKWISAGNYTITLNNQSATTAGTASVAVQINTTKGLTTNITCPEKTGYTFGGYFTETGGSGTKLINADGTWVIPATDYIDSEGKWIKSENVTLKANWIANKTTITFDNQDATTAGTTSRTIAYNSSDFGDAFVAPTKTGYTFSGYFTETQGAGIQLISAEGAWMANVEGYTSNDSPIKWIKTTTDALTLYAKWTENLYDLVVVRQYVDANGAPIGSGEYVDVIEETIPNAVGIATPYAIPAFASGYEGFHDFKWRVAQGAKVKCGASTTDASTETKDITGSTEQATITITGYKPDAATGTITIYDCKRETYYTLDVSAVNGTIQDSKTSIKVGIYTAANVTAVANTGYDFQNWTTTPTSDNYTITLATPTSATTNVNVSSTNRNASKAGSITANFVAHNYNVNVVATPATGGTITTPASSPITAHYNEPFAIAAQESEGYTFTGWTCSPENSVDFGVTDANNANSPARKAADVDIQMGGDNTPTTYARIVSDVRNQDITITANFEEVLHDVTINAENGEGATLKIGGETKEWGTVIKAGVTPVQITVVPDKDHKLSPFTVSGGANVIGGGTTFNVTATADGTVTAHVANKTRVKLYFANYAEWPTVKAYAYDNNGGKNADWPGEPTTEETINCVTYKVFSYYSEDHSWTKVIFNNGISGTDKGECKTEDLTIDGNEGHYYMPNGWKQGSTGLLTGAWQAEPYATLWAFHIKESGAEHGQDYLVSCDNNQTTASLEANTHYVFKAHNYVTGKWYGNNNGDSYIRSSIENWDFYSENTGDCNMQTTEAGTYTFAISQFVTSSQIKVSVTYPSAQTFAVTISADANGSVEPNGEQQVDAFTGISVTATPDPGYRFKEWVTSDGVSVTNPTSATTTVKASQAGTLQATFTTEGMIYFNKAGIKDKWTGDVYVYFYKGEYWDKDNTPSKGSGSSTSGNCTSGPRKMNRLGNSDIYYFDYAGAGISKESNVISFTDQYLSEAANFYKCSASYRTDFHTCANMFVPRDYIDYYNKCAYYSKGYWRTFQSTDPGYDIHIYNSKGGDGEKTYGDFTSTSNLSNDFTFTTTLDGDHTYGFKISSCGGTWYGNQGTMIQDCNWEFDSEGNYDKNCGLTTTATGEYKFTLSCTNGWLRVSVEYPLSVGDYRLAYEELSGSDITKIHPTHHIKALRADGTKTDTVSFFVEKKANAYIYLQKCTKIEGTNITWANVSSTSGNKVDLSSFDQAAGVYNFTLTQTKSSETLTPEVALLEAYEGPYYIRTDCAGGGWSSYETADNEMTKSDVLERNMADNGDYNYYFVQWVNEGINVKYCVANKYSEALTDSLKGDEIIGIDNQTLPKEANIRFMYNDNANTLERAYLNGSTNDADRYLMLIGNPSDEEGVAHIYNTEETPARFPNDEVKLEDKGNWVYQIDIQANPSARGKLTAAYNSYVQYFKGSEGDFAEETTEQIIGGTFDADSKYGIRIVYDFKTNIMVSGWVPVHPTETIPEIGLDLQADMMLIRRGQEAPQQITFAGAGTLTNIQKIYGVIELKKSDMTNYRMKGGWLDYEGYSYQFCNYYLSFPFDVKVSEIIGIDKSYYQIQKYNGTKRAAIGWFAETNTFWEKVGENDTLHAHEGYALQLSRPKMSDPDNDVWKYIPEDGSVYLYFPSADNFGGLSQQENVPTFVPDHTCTIDRTFGQDEKLPEKDRRNHMNTDSHWNMIGSPLFTTQTGVNFATAEGIDENFKHFYEWDYTHNSLTITDNTDDYLFKPMFGYMVQFYGGLLWTGTAKTAPAQIAARQLESNTNYNIELQLNYNNARVTRTYIELREGAEAGFRLNEDVYMMTTSAPANIYSFAGSYDVAANVLPEQSQIIPLGVIANQAGDFTFTCPSNFTGTITLIDKVANKEIDLQLSNYTVNLTKGTYNDRFELKIDIERGISTDFDGADIQGDKPANFKFIRNNRLFIMHNNQISTATGAVVELRHKKLEN